MSGFPFASSSLFTTSAKGSDYQFDGDIRMETNDNDEELAKEQNYHRFSNSILSHSSLIEEAHAKRFEILKLGTFSEDQLRRIQKASTRAGSSLKAIALALFRNPKNSFVIKAPVTYVELDLTINNLTGQLKESLIAASCCSKVFYRLGLGQLSQKYYDIEALKLLRSCYYLRLNYSYQ